MVPPACLAATVAHHGVPWLRLLATPLGGALDAAACLIVSHTTSAGPAPTAAAAPDPEGKKRRSATAPLVLRLASTDSALETGAVLQARQRAATALALLFARTPALQLEPILATLEHQLRGNSAVHRQAAALVAAAWGRESPERLSPVVPLLHSLLTDKGLSDVSFVELDQWAAQMRAETMAVLNTYLDAGVPLATITRVGRPGSLGVDTVLTIVRSTCDAWDADLAAMKKVGPTHDRSHTFSIPVASQHLECTRLV